MALHFFSESLKGEEAEETAPPKVYSLDIAVLCDTAYRAGPGWEGRIEKAMAELNSAFSRFDIEFRVVSTSPYEIPDTLHIKTEAFEALSAQRKGAAMAVLFSGKKFKYFAGKASEEEAAVVVCSQNKETEGEVLIHETGHVFGLDHARSQDGTNYMQAGGRKRDHFIPEHEATIRIMRERDFTQEQIPDSLVEKRLPHKLQVVERYQTDHFILGDIGAAYTRLKEYDKALLFYTKELDYLNSLGAVPMDSVKEWYASCYSNRAKAQAEAGDHEAALVTLQRAVALDSTDAGTWFSIGYNNSDLGRYQEAEAAYENAIQFKPNFHQAYHNLGNAYSRQERWEEAVRTYEEVLRLTPNSQKTHYNLIACYQGLAKAQSKTGDHEAALATIQRAVALDSTDADVWFQVGYCYNELKSYQEAIAAYEKTIHLKPDFREAHHNLMACYQNTAKTQAEAGDSRAAVAVLQQAVALDSTVANVWYQIGYYYNRLNSYQEAVVSYEKAIHLNPGDPDTHFALANVYYQQEHWKEAAKGYEETLRLDSNYKEAYFNLGLVYAYGLKNKDAAMVQYEALKKIDPKRAKELRSQIASTGELSVKWKILSGLIGLLLGVLTL